MSDLQDEAIFWEWKKDIGYPTKIQMEDKTIPKFYNFRNEGKQIFKSKLDKFGCNNKYLLRGSIYNFLIGCPTNYQSVINYDRSAFTWKNHKKLKRAYYPIGIKGGLEKISLRIEEIGALAKENNHRIIILIYPWPAQIAYSSSELNWIKFNQKLCSQIDDVCIGLLDTISIFREFAKTDNDWYLKYFIANDTHLNKEGNRIVHDAFVSFMKDKKFNK